MIEVKGLYKSFEGKTVLHNIDATFENGKTSLIIGQSGSGKTVLMKEKCSMTDATSWPWGKKKRNTCDARWE